MTTNQHKGVTYVCSDRMRTPHVVSLKKEAEELREIDVLGFAFFQALPVLKVLFVICHGGRVKLNTRRHTAGESSTASGG